MRMIFHDYLENAMSVFAIAKKLNAAGIPSRNNTKWTQAVIRRMIRNVTYTGNMLLGKFYSDGPLTQHATRNRGEMPMYYAKETHEAIIDMETFQKVQERFAYYTENGMYRGGTKNCFSGRIICQGCGRPFGRASQKMAGEVKVPAWACKKRAGDSAKCRIVTVLEDELKTICADVLGITEFSEEAFTERVDRIEVTLDDYLLFYTKNGECIDRYYPRRGKLRSEGKQNGKESDDHSGDNQPIHGSADQQRG